MTTPQKQSRAQIIATIGPVSEDTLILRSMIEHGLDIVRLNFSYASIEDHTRQIEIIRKVAQECEIQIPIIIDLPGPRVQTGAEHTYDTSILSAITDQDKKFIEFGIKQKVEYFALSFVGSASDVEKCREVVRQYGGGQKIIAKIERKIAFESLDAIIETADAIMIARGDLGNEIPIEQIPFVQEDIIKKSKLAGKPVIVATQMMLSMTDNPLPTRAEVTDVTNAVLQGADAVMLSEETAKGSYPVEAVAMMEKIIIESENHQNIWPKYNQL